jgi:4-amino-4-deoxy-L-arabinose transferase-like glycosyltransferase
MRTFFEGQAERFYSALTVFGALVTLFFIAPQTKFLTLLDFGTTNTPFYIGFLIFGILSLGAVAYFSEVLFSEKTGTTLLLMWLPSATILAYGLSESKNFHYIFLIGLGLYVILAGTLISAIFISRERAERELDRDALTPRAWWRAQGLPTLLVVLFATGLFFSTGMYRLTEFAAVDEPLWFDGRIARYWKNIGERDWKGTNISDKPGITVALATGPALWFKGTKDYKTAHVGGEVISLKNDVESFYLAYRLPLLIVITLLLPLFYFFLERLLGRRSALLAYVLIATSPILIGMSKIINPDSLLWLFTPLSLLSYLVFQKRGSYRYLIFAGIFLGLALLTKYVSNILFVFFLGLIFLEYLYHAKYALVPFALYLKRSLKHLALLAFAALTTFYLLFPAVWIKPYKVVTSTLLSQAFEKVAPLFGIILLVILLDQWWNRSRLTTGILSVLARGKQYLAWFIGGVFLLALLVTVGNTWSGMPLYSFSELLSSPKTIAGQSDFIGIFLTNFYPFIFGVAPIVFVALFLTPFLFFRKHWSESDALRTSFYLIIFILLYYLGTTVNNVAAIVRYQIILFPLAAIIAGITIEYLLAHGHHYFKLKNAPTPVGTALILVVLGTLTLITTPFPLSYASSFLPACYHTDVKDMGAGSYEAAAYLNSLPGAEDMLIWTDKDGVCKFFVGRCSSSQSYLTLRERGLDYIVVSAGRQSRTGKMMGGDIANNKPGIIRFDRYYDRENPVYEININERPSHYVKVFSFDPKETY